MNGGGALPFRSFASTITTVRAASKTCARAVSACSLVARRGSVPSNFSFSPFHTARRAGNAASPFFSVTGTEKYGTGTKRSRSLSRSTMMRSVTVWTRPAESPRQTFDQRRSDTS